MARLPVLLALAAALQGVTLACPVVRVRDTSFNSQVPTWFLPDTSLMDAARAWWKHASAELAGVVLTQSAWAQQAVNMKEAKLACGHAMEIAMVEQPSSDDSKFAFRTTLHTTPSESVSVCLGLTKTKYIRYAQMPASTYTALLMGTDPETGVCKSDSKCSIEVRRLSRALHVPHCSRSLTQASGPPHAFIRH